MKKIAICLCISIASCRQVASEQRNAWRQNIIEQSESKVRQIEQQLKDDCDSSVLAVARFKADSIRTGFKKKPLNIRAR